MEKWQKVKIKSDFLKYSTVNAVHLRRKHTSTETAFSQKRLNIEYYSVKCLENYEKNNVLIIFFICIIFYYLLTTYHNFDVECATDVVDRR